MDQYLGNVLRVDLNPGQILLSFLLAFALSFLWATVYRKTHSGIAYTRSGNRAFQLMAYGPNGDAIIYDSANPLPAFRPLGDAWSAPEGTP